MTLRLPAGLPAEGMAGRLDSSSPAGESE